MFPLGNAFSIGLESTVISQKAYYICLVFVHRIRKNKNAISNKFLLSKKMSINGYHVPFIVYPCVFLYKNFFFAKTECFLHLFNISFLLPFSTLVSNKNIRKTFSYFISVNLSCSKQFEKVKKNQHDVLNSFFVKRILF